VVAAAGPVALIDEALLERTLAGTLRRGDKGGDIFYDLISALHKSVRASQPDATLYWLARLLDAGIDARYVARRLVRMASEDIGLADPRALGLTQDAAMAWERLGSPEGDLALAEAAVYLAVAPKSNAVYKAFGAARAAVAQHGTLAVPMHLRNAPTKLMKQLGHGAGYRYAHDDAEGYSAGFECLPQALADVRWYQPTGRGLEARIGEKLAAWRERDAASKAELDSSSSG
jgi:putative ATPase